MDNPAFGAVPTAARFVPDRRYTLAAAAGALVAAGAILLADDGPGRLLAVVALVVLLAYVVCDLFFTPRLLVTTDGIVINSPTTRARLAWPEVDSVQARSRDRLGLRSVTLEVDAGAVLAVFSRRALGADPEDAASLIASFRT